jgi:hypothetical protein
MGRTPALYSFIIEDERTCMPVKAMSVVQMHRRIKESLHLKGLPCTYPVHCALLREAFSN